MIMYQYKINGENTFRSTHWIDEQTQTQTLIKIKIKHQGTAAFRLYIDFRNISSSFKPSFSVITVCKAKTKRAPTSKEKEINDLNYFTFAWERAWATLQMSSMSLWSTEFGRIARKNFHFRWRAYCSTANQITSSDHIPRPKFGRVTSRLQTYLWDFPSGPILASEPVRVNKRGC